MDFKALYECLSGSDGKNGGTQNTKEASTMTLPTQPGFKGFIFGLRAEEQNKTFILSVEAISSMDATEKFIQAINTIKNNEFVIEHGCGIAGNHFRFYIHNDSLQQETTGKANGLTAGARLDASHEIRLQTTELIDQQLRGVIDAITARASWYKLVENNGGEALADYLTWALHDAMKRSSRKQVSYGTGIIGIPLPGSEHEQRAESYAEICRVITGQINDNRDLNRASKFWHDYLNRPDCDRAMLVDALMHVLSCTYADQKDA
ncbi:MULTISPECIES: hypothetical protein [Citrobacter]|uniref:Uncharacterized protein n=1 Tax=Citrobacter amalonaticus TaxID=35703 RepID=A0A8I0MJV1_CITAM|nr:MULTISPECIES: hypothetical protein [Citrobacter]MBE0128170.1 hypothetical protein [Citrobacter amalonaticus]MDB2179594.1 hypothetical protein [Citrobacter farmeri]HCB1596864.1 hypothetical protein [Citrobacter farmeri]